MRWIEQNRACALFCVCRTEKLTEAKRSDLCQACPFDDHVPNQLLVLRGCGRRKFIDQLSIGSAVVGDDTRPDVVDVCEFPRHDHRYGKIQTEWYRPRQAVLPIARLFMVEDKQIPARREVLHH